MIDSLGDLTSNVRLILGKRTKLPQKSPRKFASGPQDDGEFRPAIAASLAPATNPRIRLRVTPIWVGAGVGFK
uniref:Unannotated protein n=1 Tax=freshwater metagenome TaxID=449393 RepID=A0A6J7MSG6_9ZZZZ